MKKVYLIAILALIVNLSKAQDVIIKKNTDEIECKVVEIEEGNLKYRKYSHLDGPIYNISTDDIFMVKYENGEKEVFATEQKAVVIEETKDTAITPNRWYAIRVGLSVGNVFNTILVYDEATIISNNNMAITFNSFSKNRRFSSSFTLAPFKVDSYHGLYQIDYKTQEARGYAFLGEFYVHYGMSPKSSFYSGLGAGLISYKRTLTYYLNYLEEIESVIAPSYHLTIFGSEYYITPNIGIYSEIGLGRKGILSGGVQLQF
ncbi:hypothetical protein N9772_02895 [Bacteroidia bacterium]|nr:hypothetical protein [Bacteroidia bacterium]